MLADDFFSFEIAEALFNLSDKTDVEESEKEAIIQDLDYCIFDIEAIAKNPINRDAWRTFYNCLAGICRQSQN